MLPKEGTLPSGIDHKRNKKSDCYVYGDSSD